MEYATSSLPADRCQQPNRLRPAQARTSAQAEMRRHLNLMGYGEGALLRVTLESVLRYEADTKNRRRAS